MNPMNDDAALLRRFVEERSEAAFAELVQRYVNLVYRASLRRTGGDLHPSADVTQIVFTALAGNARRLSPDTVLGAWLHTATRNAAQKVMISEQRRRTRERAYAMETSSENVRADPDWEQVRPVLDNAIDELPALDRTSLVLRFFERRTYSEIGAVLQIPEDAARVRTDRALDKLRTRLSRHGVTSTATALSIVISSEPLIAAPAGLAASLTVHSLAAAGSGIALSALTSFMTTKIITTAGISAVVAFWAGSYFGFSKHPEFPPSIPEANGKLANIISIRESTPCRQRR